MAFAGWKRSLGGRCPTKGQRALQAELLAAGGFDSGVVGNPAAAAGLGTGWDPHKPRVGDPAETFYLMA